MANPTTPYTAQDGRLQIDVTEAKTLTAADSGIVQNVIADNVVVTLPATAASAAFTVRNGGAPITSGGPAGATSNQSAKVSVSPQAGDQLIGNGFTAADDKDAINTKATSNVGDEITVIGNGGTGYVISAVRGTWDREA